MKYLCHFILITTCAFLSVGCNPSQTENSPVENSESSREVDKSSHIARILFWNVESGGNDPNVIAEQLAEFSDYDVITLCEVGEASFDLYSDALGEDFQSVNSATGRADRMQIHFNKDRFELIESKEMDQYRDYIFNNGYYRSPFYVHLKDNKSGKDFIVMTNHLARGKADFRTTQAIGLREWARDQTIPIVAIGDFNMDYDFHTEAGNEAFKEFLRDNIWEWVKPDPLIDSNWADEDGDGQDNYPDSILDFAFVAGSSREWSPVSNVIVREGDFPDNEQTSDHRPVDIILEIPESE